MYEWDTPLLTLQPRRSTNYIFPAVLHPHVAQSFCNSSTILFAVVLFISTISDHLECVSVINKYILPWKGPIKSWCVHCHATATRLWVVHSFQTDALDMISLLTLCLHPALPTIYISNFLHLNHLCAVP